MPVVHVYVLNTYRYKIVLTGFRVRMIGSAAVNLCMVASGSGEAYYEYGIHIWDFAAAGIIFTEAGGLLLDPAGSLLMSYPTGSLLLYLTNSSLSDSFMHAR